MPKTDALTDLDNAWCNLDRKASVRELQARKARARADIISFLIRERLQTEIDRCIALYQKKHPDRLHFGKVLVKRDFNPTAASVTLEIQSIKDSDGSDYYGYIGAYGWKHADWMHFDAFLRMNLSWRNRSGFVTTVTDVYYDSGSRK